VLRTVTLSMSEINFELGYHISDISDDDERYLRPVTAVCMKQFEIIHTW